jgi:excinuclease ABC subunit C
MTHPPFDLDTFLAHLPALPGVYRMYDAKGLLLYVGKAKSLKNRVKSYFAKNNQLSPKGVAMVSQIERMDFILTDSEVEALLLEANLIKTLKPKYNIVLRDDKRYPWIGISNEAFPRLFITRTPNYRGKAKFFGPYTNTGDMYATLKEIRRHFPLRQRRKPLFQTRPCMNYFIGNCSGPCQKLITPEAYQDIVKQVEFFLKGKADDLLELIHTEMQEAAEAMNFERAAKLRDRYRAVENLVSNQKMLLNDPKANLDVIAGSEDGLRCAITVLTVRKGKLIGSRSQDMPLPQDATLSETMSSFLYTYYDHLQPEDLPDFLLVQYPPEDPEFLSAWLTQKRQTAKSTKKVNTKAKPKTKIETPIGTRPTPTIQLVEKRNPLHKDLLQMAEKNAQEALEQAKRQDATRMRNDPTRALIELQVALNLPDLPARIECYDISHFQGSQTVASMVVFQDGVADKQSYRRFKIHCAEGLPNDFDSMAEVIQRRFSHKEEEPGWEEPDLVIIDGGKGQLGAAQRILKNMGIDEQPMISLAKKFEEVFVPGQSRPIILPRDSIALFLLQQIRDEAHRFAITYHRSLRGKKALASELDDIEGIGAKRKAQLLEAFQTVEKIKSASIQELASALSCSIKIASKLHEALHASS